jgi:hypothetical protein
MRQVPPWVRLGVVSASNIYRPIGRTDRFDFSFSISFAASRPRGLANKAETFANAAPVEES